MADEDWDVPTGPTPVAARRAMLPNRRAAVAGSAAVVLAVAAVLVVTGAVRDRRSPVHTVLCAAPTASWSPGSPTAVGAPGAARVGPFTFHPAVTGVPGTPARVIIHPVEA
ncbi:MAG TPA: hypothetical protein VFA84_05360, partial [Acidimicrobiales bacterium]|nr:hypothetical protein [Acidimicrobiales bacterium]